MFANIVTRVRADPFLPRAESNLIVVKIRVPLPEKVRTNSSGVNITEETISVVTYTATNEMPFNTSLNTCRNVQEKSLQGQVTIPAQVVREGITTTGIITTPRQLVRENIGTGGEINTPEQIVTHDTPALAHILTVPQSLTRQEGVNERQSGALASDVIDTTMMSANSRSDIVHRAEHVMLKRVSQTVAKQQQESTADVSAAVLQNTPLLKEKSTPAPAFRSTPVPKVISANASGQLPAFKFILKSGMTQSNVYKSISNTATKPTTTIRVPITPKKPPEGTIAGTKHLRVAVKGVEYWAHIDGDRLITQDGHIQLTNGKTFVVDPEIKSEKELLENDQCNFTQTSLSAQNECKRVSPGIKCDQSNFNIDNDNVSVASNTSDRENTRFEQFNENIPETEVNQSYAPIQDYTDKGQDILDESHVISDEGYVVLNQSHDLMKLGHEITIDSVTEYDNEVILTQDTEMSQTDAKFTAELLDDDSTLSATESTFEQSSTKSGRARMCIAAAPVNRPAVVSQNRNTTCDICNETLDSYDRMLRHRESHFETLGGHTCATCGVTFHNTLHDFKLHVEDCEWKQNIHAAQQSMTDAQQSMTEAQQSMTEAQQNGTETWRRLYRTCSMCAERFQSRDDYYAHMESAHRDARHFSCSKCGEQMHTVESVFQTHVGLCTARNLKTDFTPSEGNLSKNDVLKCHLCDKTFKGKINLKRHVRRHTSLGYKCDLCKKSYAQSRYLKMHKQRVHMKVEADGNDKYRVKKYSCHLCSYTAYEMASIRIHMRKHTGEKPYACEKCNRAFTTKSALNCHLNRHDGFKPHACDFCSDAFFTSSALLRHKAHHTGDRPFKCRDCLMTFRLEVHLKSHRAGQGCKKVPYNTGQFECDICHRTYHTDYDMREHKRRRHFTPKTENERIERKKRLIELRLKKNKELNLPHICDVCSFGFRDLRSLKQHKRRHNSSERKFKCGECGKGFMNNNELNTHRSSHSDARPFACDYCGKTFKVKKLVVKHMRYQCMSKPDINISLVSGCDEHKDSVILLNHSQQ